MDYTYSTCLYDYRKFITADQYPQCTTEELNARHLKILEARESLLYGTPDPDKLNKTSTLDRKQSLSAAQRNKKLIDDIRKTKAKMVRNTRFHENRAAKLQNISKNYWSMVKNLQPIWEKSISR